MWLAWTCHLLLLLLLLNTPMTLLPLLPMVLMMTTMTMTLLRALACKGSALLSTSSAHTWFCLALTHMGPLNQDSGG